MIRTAAVLVLILTAGCTAQPAAGPSPRFPSPQPRSPEVAPYVRDCRTSVYGDLGRGWEKDALTVGRVSFVALASNAAREAGWWKHPSGTQSLKVLVVVRDGAPVTVAVAPEDRVALQYDPTRFNRSRSLADGDPAVRFVPCGPGEGFTQARGETQFNGGWLVTGPTCATVETSEAGTVTDRTEIALAGGSCPAVPG